MIAMTADPAGDVSQRARSGLIAAVSKATFAVARCGSERGGVERDDRLGEVRSLVVELDGQMPVGSEPGVVCLVCGVES